MKRFLKRFILSLIYPKGSTAKVLRGPLKGYKFVIGELGWSPIFGTWETEYQNLFEKIIKKGQTVFDLGANEGVHTLLFAKLTGSTGQITSFEPLIDNVAAIQQNLSVNNLTHVEIVNKAVSKNEGTTMFNVGVHPTQGGINGIGERSGEQIEIDVTTLDAYVESSSKIPDFIKVDIEGEEGNALMGSTQILQKYKPALLVELHTLEQDKLVGSILLKHGYNAYRISTNGYSKEPKLHEVTQIKDLSKVFPEPDGIWGTILAIHETKDTKSDTLDL